MSNSFRARKVSCKSTQRGTTTVETLVALVFFMIVVFLVVVEVLVPAIEEHEKRYIETMAAP